MKLRHFIFIIAILLSAAVAFVAADFLLPESTPRETQPQETQPEPTGPQFLEGTFGISPQTQEPQEPVELSLQGAKEGKTIRISWDESKVRIFHIVLLHPKLERQTIWLLSFIGGLPENLMDIKRENISSFIPSGYVIGDAMEGFQLLEDFQSPDRRQEFELTLGQQYYLQMLGFTKDDQSIATNKKFTFTSSCLPPDCQ